MLEQELKELIGLIKNTTQEQLPLVADEILRWGMLKECWWMGCWFSLAILFTFGCLKLIKLAKKEIARVETLEKPQKEEKDEDYDYNKAVEIYNTEVETSNSANHILDFIGPAIIMVDLVCFIAVALGVKAIIYIHYAPRLYIIEYLRGLL